MLTGLSCSCTVVRLLEFRTCVVDSDKWSLEKYAFRTKTITITITVTYFIYYATMVVEEFLLAEHTERFKSL